MKKHILLGLASFFIFSAATIYITYPLIFHMSDFVSGEYVIAWILNWNIHSILTGNLLNIFNGNIYYPFPLSLAYSTPFFTSTLISILPFLILHQPIVPSNVVFLTSLVSLGFFTYLLSYYLTKNFWASFLSGLLVIFCPLSLDKRVHLQVLSLQWIPLSLLFFFHFTKTGKFRFLVLCLLFFIVQTYNDFLPGYFLMFFLIILSGLFYFTNNTIRKRLLQWKNLFALITALLIILPIGIPYLTISKKYDYIRNIRDAIHFAIQPEDLLVTDENSRLNSVLVFFHSSPDYPSYAEVQPGFPGFTFTILAFATLFYFVRKKKKDTIAFGFIITGFLGFILAFGPALHWARRTIHYPFLIPLPYAIFYYIVPGFQAFRNSARFEMLFVISLPIASALMLTDMLKEQKKWVMVLIYIILIVGTVWEFNFPLHFDHAPTFAQFPPVYHWIAKNTPQNAVILETPMYNWDNNPFGNNQEVMREYYSTIHFRRIVGGGSGFSPPPWQSLAIDMFNNFPSAKTLTTIKKLGVTYIVVHKKEYDILYAEKWKSRGHGVPSGSSVLSFLQNTHSVSFVTNFGNDYVYKVIY